MEKTKITFNKDKGLSGTLEIDGGKYIWYVNRDYRLVVETIDRSGDLTPEHYEFLDGLIGEGDITNWIGERVKNRYNPNFEDEEIIK